MAQISLAKKLRGLMLLMICSSNVGALGKDAHSASGYAVMGDQFRQSGRYRDAISQYGKAVKVDKHNARIFLARAECELALAQYKKALADTNRSLKLNPRDAESLATRAKTFNILKEYKKEKRDLDALMELQPSGANMLLRAQAKMHLKDYQSALDDCNVAVNTGLTRDQLAQLYFLRSQLYKKLGRKTDYEQELAKYNSLQP